MPSSVSAHRDAVSGGVLLVLAGLYFFATRDLPPGQDEPGPAFFPVLLSGALSLLALILLVRGLQSRRTLPSHPKPSVAEHRWRPSIVIALTILYVATFTTLGFAVSTWLYTLLVTVTFRRDRPILPVAVPILSTALIYLLFEIGLGARLPPGFWGAP